MRWCEICRWYLKERQHMVYCKKDEILFRHDNCDFYEPTKLFLYGVSKSGEAPAVKPKA